MVLDALYKTNYSNTDSGHDSGHGVSESGIPLRYYKTTHTARDQVFTTFLSHFLPSGPLNIVGGFGGAMLVEAEMKGIPAALFTAIVDSHYVTSETL